MLHKIVENLQDQNAKNIKIVINIIVETVALSTATLYLSITYSLKGGDKLASPRRSELEPAFSISSVVYFRQRGA